MAIGRIPEPGTGIQESIVDAKGDLISATAADTPARLAVGADGTTLVADSAEATGLKWAAPAGSSPSWSLLSTTATTSGTQISLTSLSGYNQFLIRFAAVSATAAGQTIFNLQFNSVTSGSKYSWFGELGYPGGGATLLSGDSGAATDDIKLGANNNAASNLNGYLFLQGGNGSGSKVGHYIVAPDGITSGDRHRFNGFVFDSTSVISSIQFNTEAGTFDAGSILLYGSVN